jgi:WD40 repeat protein
MRNQPSAFTVKTSGRHCIALAALELLAGQLVGQTMQHERAVTSTQFSPDGQQVLTGSWDRTARLWDAATGKPLGEGGVISVQFSPDGKRVLSKRSLHRAFDGLPTERPPAEPRPIRTYKKR